VVPSTTRVTRYTFNFGDGTVLSTNSTATTYTQSHTYSTLGPKTVTVTVDTSGGSFTAQSVVNVVVG
jgi:PKD repeat protein